MENGFYGDSRILLEAALSKTLAQIDIIRKYEKVKENDDPVAYITSRIKEEPIEIEGTQHNVYVEIQIRTIAMDFWSSLEHEIKYKKNIKNTEIIVSELKKCADMIATTDLNMQSIKNLIDNS